MSRVTFEALSHPSEREDDGETASKNTEDRRTITAAYTCVSRQAGSESALVAFSVVVRIDLRYLEVVHMYRRLSIFAELSRKAKKRELERAREKDGKTVSLISIIENRIKEWLAKRSLMIEGAEICLQISCTL